MNEPSETLEVQVKKTPHKSWRTMNKTQRAAVRLKIGLRHTDPLPKCPVKAQKRVKMMEMEGDFSHSDYFPPENWDGTLKGLSNRNRTRKTKAFHAPCEKCGCTNTAGTGTNHYGWGLCRNHETSRGYRPMKDAVAERHLRALQQRHPFHYSEAQQMVEDIKDKALDKPGNMTIQQEIQKVGSLLGRFYETAETFDRKRNCAPEATKAINDLIHVLKEHGKDIDSEQALHIEQLLEDINTRLSCPLTELSAGTVVPMTDKTLYGLIANTAPKLTKSVKDLFDMMKEQWFTEDSYWKWFSLVLRSFEKRFGEKTFSDGENQTEKITDVIAEVMKNCGDPRRGT